MKKFWPYIASFFAGIVAGMLLMVSKVKPVNNISGDYLESVTQEVGKIKQKKGENNEQTTKGEIGISTPNKSEAVSDKKIRRKERREEKKLNRKNRKQ